MRKIQVLLVEDEPVIAQVLKDTLELRGFAVSVAANGVEGWGSFMNQRPDICLLDIMLPRKDGYALLKDVRTVDEFVPVIFLTAKDLTEDVLKGFELGADDYIRKPFSIEELIVRLKAVLRRRFVSADIEEQKSLPTIGSFVLDQSQMILKMKGREFQLSRRESELLTLLSTQKNDLLDRRTALLKLWGEDSVFTARSMDVYITRLRKFLSEDKNVEIQNVRGKGYRLIVKP